MVHLITVMISAAISVVVSASQEAVADGNIETGGDTIPAVVWIEVDASSASALDTCEAGLREWGKLTNTAMISVGAGKSAFYRRLRERMPHLTIIPSLKTSGLFGHCGFDSLPKWGLMAKYVRAAREATGSKQVGFENEMALKKYYAGECKLDLARLEQGLRLLPADVEYLWYPSAAGEGAKLQRHAQLDRVVEKVLNVRFIDHVTLNAPQHLASYATRRAADELKKVAKNPTVPLIYCCGDRWWPYERVPEALGLAKEKWGQDSWSLIFPGQGRWLQSARSIAKALEQRSPAREP
ncbi:MAG: hypothetical protein JSU63_15755 [Phycisphaerales bacterium]|nr:MAG: hypothetical protein JSU63_15755 [Phycisphaerales bacterium]